MDVFDPRNLDPHHRINDAVRYAESPDEDIPNDLDNQTLALIYGLRGKPPTVDLYHALRKYQNPFSRNVLTGFLLAEAKEELITKTTGMAAGVLTAYVTYIFDNSIFSDKMDRFSYAHAVRNFVSAEHAAFLEAAVTHGPEYLVWMLNGDPSHTPKDIMASVMVDALYRGRAHRNAAITSPAAKEARAWLSLAGSTATNAHRLDPSGDADDALRDLKLALSYEDETTNEETPGAPAPGDILH
jgi:hypothetical protein